MLQFFKRIKLTHWPIIGILILVLVLFFTNYTPGTWLTGWDTLHPEFDFPLNISRVISGVWRPEQGVGDVAIHSHMSELPRILLMWIWSAVFPLSMLRYMYIFLCLFVGSVGMYLYLHSIFKTKTIPFITSCLYILNLTVLQHLFIPFEMFPTQFAFLPWIFYFSNKIFKEKSIKNWIGLATVSFLGAPQAYAATLFYAFAMCYLLYAIINIIFAHKNRIESIKRWFLCGLIIIFTNSFWLIPNLYSIKTQSSVVENSRINEQFSQEAFLRNKDYGKVENVLEQKSFLFSWRIFNFQNNQFEDLLIPWKKYLDNPFLKIIQVLIIGFSLFGIVIGISKKKPETVGILAVTLLSAFFLINENPPTGNLYSLLQKISLFREGFRMPFTKFSILYLFGITYFFSFSLLFIENFIFKISRSKYLKHTVSILVLLFSFLIMLPAFQGNLISPKLRVVIPNEYFDLFDWFKVQPTGRIAKLPLNTMWGWTYSSWGYQGSGFLWFGIEQPQFDRDFDRWSINNENFYRELSKANRDQDVISFEKILDKYQVTYLIFDKSIINAGETKDDNVDPQKFLKTIKSISEIKSFKNLSVYKYNNKNSINSLLPVYDNYQYTQDDLLFKEKGNYSQNSESNISIFDGITDLRNKHQIKLSNDGKYINYDFTVTPNAKKTNLLIPNYSDLEEKIIANIYGYIENNKIYLKIEGEIPIIKIDGQKEYGGSVILYQDLFTTSKEKPSYLHINDKIYPINLQKDMTKIATTILPIKKSFKVGLYSGSQTQINGFIDGIRSNQVSECANPENKIPLVTGSRSFSLTVGDKSLCIGNTLPISKKSLLSVKLETLSPDRIAPKFCVIPEGEVNCLDNPNPEIKLSFGGSRDEEYILPVDVGSHWFSFVAQGQEGKNRTITYENIQISIIPVIDEKDVTVFLPFINQSDLIKKIDSNQKIEIEIPSFPIADETFDRGRGNSQAVNCDIDKIGSVTKTNTGSGVFYNAKNGGVSCDYYDYPQIEHTDGYLLRISGENIEGRSIKFYLQNQKTGFFDTEEVLPNGKYDLTYPILPTIDGGKGYVINLESRSFGSISASNILNNIQIIPIPYSWLRHLIIKGDDTNSGQNITNIEVSNKFGWLSQRVDLNENSTLVLSQSFDPGWVAFQNGKFLNHFKVNGWANGWESQSAGQVTIFFWPQLLQYLGFILLLMPFLYAFIYYIIDKRS